MRQSKPKLIERGFTRSESPDGLGTQMCATDMGIPGEHHFFFGSPHEPLFGVLHHAARVAGQEPFGVVICSSFAHEHGFSHRMLVEWARALSGIGATVLRFDYRGHGDSAGSFEQYTVEDLLDDVFAAITELERRSGVECQGLCGLRLGATLAALAASRDDREPFLVLWEPILQGDKYLDELLRVVLAKYLTSGRQMRRTRSELKRAILQGAGVSVEGHLITEALFRSLAEVDLLKLSRYGKGPTFIVQVSNGRSSPIRTTLEDLSTAYAKAGHSDLRSVCAPPLWYGSLVKEYNARVRPVSLFDQSLQWIRTQMDGADRGSPEPAQTPRPATFPTVQPLFRPSPAVAIGARSLNRASSLACNEINETVVSFSVAGVPLAGILHLPGDLPPQRPVIVMLPQGMNRRTGWNRLYVKLARALADRGWVTLRFDARGLGDSEGELDMPTGADLFFAVEEGMHVDDASEAISYVQRVLGPRPVILAGVCGGAETASLLAADDERVSGAALLETQLLYTPRTPAVQPMWRYNDKIRSLDAWRRVLSFKADFRHHLRSVSAAIVGRVAAWRHRSEHQWLIDALGPLANVGLVTSLRRCIERRLPILYVTGSTDSGQCFTRIRSRLLASVPEAHTWFSEHVVQGADHDFLEAQHADELMNVLTAWLDDPRQPWANEGSK